MQEKRTWFGDRAFGKEAAGLVTVNYKAHQEALNFLEAALNTDMGVGLLQGPEGSGKTTTARRLKERLPGHSAVASVDGTRIKSTEMMAEMLLQFGYDIDLETDYELESMIRMFATQQAQIGVPPVLIVDNVDRMYPSALRALNSFAELKSQDRYAMRLALTGRDGLHTLVASEGMPGLRKRVTGSCSLQPLTIKETMLYLHARLNACGMNDAEAVFPVSVCDRLFEQSGGLPGPLNEAALEVIGHARSFPLKVTDTVVVTDTVAGEQVQIEPIADIPVLGAADATGPLPPSLTISKNGRVVSEFTLKESKVLIGRSDFADVVLDDQFASKMHALLLLFSDALVLLDLNSSNGTTVNSAVTRSTILKSDDVISLGDHRLKVRNAPAISDEMAKLRKSPDTIKMKNLIEMRRHREQRLALVSSESEKQG